jgi:hypothetical protein
MNPEEMLRRAALALVDERCEDCLAALREYATWREDGGEQPPKGDEAARLLATMMSRVWDRRDGQQPYDLGDGFDVEA